ncbi:MAG: phospho-N-acetylmuramoyl-pentapeptide-transferase [Bacteroidota bacterium]
MLYHLALWLEKMYHPPGFGVFQYITVRAAAATITALLISFIAGPRLIKALQSMQLSEQAKLELEQVGLHVSKTGTPTMGGLIILLALLLPTLLWANIQNMFIILVMLTTAWLGVLGFLDDYLKVVRKLRKGLISRYKIIGQVSIGLIVGCTVYFYPEMFSQTFDQFNTLTTVPFQKHINFDWGWLYIPAVVFIMTATSNAVNLTDGIDGLAIGTVGIVALAIGVMAYATGNAFFADFLNIMHLRGADELAIFCAALVGAALGFLWYNAYPAQIFMGDTGSLALGGAIGALCILIKKEFLIPILGGIFFLEAMTVILQVMYFKYTKKRFGEGRRLFRVAPLHHHFEKEGWHESKVVMRFYIIAVMLAIFTVATFKVR